MPDIRDYLPIPPWEGLPLPPSPPERTKEYLKPSPEEVKRLLPEYHEVLKASGGYKPVKFVENITILRTPALFNPSAQGDFAFTHSFTWNGRALSSGPAFSYDTMLSTRVNPYEREVTVPAGTRVWVTTYDGQWGGHWARVDAYVNERDFEYMAAQVRGVLKPAVDLTEREKKILATIRAYTANYRREVFKKNKVTLAEMDELHTKGLVDARGVLTKTGRLIIGYEDPWY